MTRKLWAGLDVGVETTRVCIIDDAGEVLHEATCATKMPAVRKELALLKRHRHTRISIEAGPGSHLARGLRSSGFAVDLYETRQLSRFLAVRRNKTDAGDAIGIAEAGRIGASLVSRVHLKSLECQILQSRLSIRRSLIRIRVKLGNLIGRHVDHFGGRLSKMRVSPKMSLEVEAILKELFGRSSGAPTADLRRLLKYWEMLLTEQRVIDQELRAYAAGNETCQRFMEIPGVGPICALTFYASVADPHRFMSSAQIGPYLGLTPKVRQSGLARTEGRISKMGNTAARTALVNSAIHFMKCGGEDSALRMWAVGVEQRRGRKKARVALARKLATVMIAMWRRGESYACRPAALAMTDCPGRAAESRSRTNAIRIEPRSRS